MSNSVSNYITEEELKATLELTNQTFAEHDLTGAVDSASRAIDAYCGRRFYADTADQVRYYSPTRGDLLWIDDLITLTSMKTDTGFDNTFTDTWTVDTDFVLEPRSAPADSRPYQSIRRLPSGNFWWSTYYQDTVKITGKFGWAEVPAQIKEATTILASRLFRRAREAPFGVLTIGVDVGSVARLSKVDPDVRFLLDPFRRWRPFV